MLLIWSHQRYTYSATLTPKENCKHGAHSSIGFSVSFAAPVYPAQWDLRDSPPCSGWPAGPRREPRQVKQSKAPAPAGNWAIPTPRLERWQLRSALVPAPFIDCTLPLCRVANDGRVPGPGMHLRWCAPCRCLRCSYVLAAAAGGRFLGSRVPDTSHRAIYPLTAPRLRLARVNHRIVSGAIMWCRVYNLFGNI
jgi:hypothetical protein